MSLHYAYRVTKGVTRFGWSGFGTIRILDCDPTTLNVGKGHYRKQQNCRVPEGLPSAFHRALGQHPIYRVFLMQHSVNIQHSAKPNFAECLIKNTRQTIKKHSANIDTRQSRDTCAGRTAAM